MIPKPPLLARAGTGSRLVRLAILGIAIIAAGLVGTGPSVHAGTTAPTLTVSPGVTHAISTPRLAVRDMRRVPAATPGELRGTPGTITVGLGVDPHVYAPRKAAALRDRTLPAQQSPYGMAPALPGERSARGPLALTRQRAFQGMSDSNATCPFFSTGCAPPDMALAVGRRFVLQGVNTSIAVYDMSGVLQAGFPKTFQAFFGIPAPVPSGCTSKPPFTSDPRAFYEPNDNRYFVTALEMEGADSKNASCSLVSKYWFAVSQTGDPRGAWNIYAVDMTFGTTNVADYTMIGFDSKALYFSANMFDRATTSAFQYAEICGGGKAAIEAGLNFAGNCKVGPTVNGVLVDTLQPVDSMAHDAGPASEFFVNSFNIKFGGGQCASGCSGLVLWAFSNVLGEQGSAPILSGVVLPSIAYSLAPLADNPGTGGCMACIETIDTRITATPFYAHGEIWGALETKANNGSQNVPAVFFFSIEPVLDHGTGTCPWCTAVQNTSQVEDQGLYYYNGDGAAFFATLMPDAEGNIVMGFEFSGNGFDPSSAVTSRRTTEAPSSMADGGSFLVASTKPTLNRRWGDYEASSWDGYSSDRNWVALEHSCPSSGDWCTEIAQYKFIL